MLFISAVLDEFERVRTFFMKRVGGREGWREGKEMQTERNNCINMLKKINTVKARLDFWKKRHCEKMINE